MPRGIRARRRYRSTWRSRTTRRRPMFVTSAPASTRTRGRLTGGGSPVRSLGPRGGPGARPPARGEPAPEAVTAILRAAARGYVTKSISADELVAAVQRVHGGDVVFSPRLAGFVLDAFAGGGPAPAGPAPPP